MRCLFVPIAVMILTAYGQTGAAAGLGEPIEIDDESDAEIYLLGGDERPADNIYGEQPYGDATGRRIAIRYHSLPNKPGGINILDLRDGSNHEILSGKSPRPAFHAWGQWLYYSQTVEGKKMLRRCNYLTLEVESVAELPPGRGIYSHGSVSPDHRYFAVSVRTLKGGPSSQVHLLDLWTNRWSVLLDKPGYHAKHEQFSRDGRNRVLIQLNQMPKVKVVLLGELEIGGAEKRFPADQPYTLRPTGHEAWIGNTSSIFFSTGADATSKGNIWSGKVGDKKPVLVHQSKRFFGHVSVSRDGKYWIADTEEKGFPIYIGSFATGRCKRICFSRTVYDGKQWSHAHPYLTANNKWLIFGARRNDHPQVHGAKLKDGWLETF